MGCSYEELQGVLKALGYEPKKRDLSKFPPMPDFTQDDAASQTDETSKPSVDNEEQSDEKKEQIAPKAPEPQINKTEEVSDTAPVQPETQSLAETTSDSPTGSEETPKGILPAKKLYKKRPPKPLNIYNHRDVQEDGTSVEIENNEFWVTPFRQKNARQNKPNRKHQSRRPKPKSSNQDKKYQSGTSKPKSNPENSPFAALAALKADKKDS